MGRSYTPTFRLEMTNQYASVGFSNQAWETKYAGRPTNANLAKHIAFFEASTRGDGCNAHLGSVTITNAKVIRQSNGDVEATYEAS